jgi:hypothetical protein
MEIIKAEYGKVDCTEIIQSKVKGNRIALRVDNSIVGDTNPGVVKYLEVVLEFEGKVYSESIREGGTFVYPKSINNRLGIWYSNDQTSHPAVIKSLETIQKAAENKADIITCVWYSVPNNPFTEVISWNRSSSHLNQMLQILQCIYTAKTMGNYDYVSFLEHDVMYGEGYFDYPDFERGAVWTNMNYGGINRDGWQERGQNDEPMHQMTMRIDDAIEHFTSILPNALVTNSGMIETQTMERKQWNAVNQSIHINHGSHFTSHFNIYKKDNLSLEHSYWGNHKDYLHLFN